MGLLLISLKSFIFFFINQMKMSITMKIKPIITKTVDAAGISIKFVIRLESFPKSFLNDAHTTHS